MIRPTALITGGSRGIGLGIARELARQGTDLAINGMRAESEVIETLNELRASGGSVIYCQGDIGDAVSRNNMIEKIRKEYGRLHWLVNNAGIAPKERLDILQTTEESFAHVLATNLQGAFFLSQLAARWMLEQKEKQTDFSGGIINISSISATVASINRGEYCIAKAGLSMATQLFAARLGEASIPVYEIRPGVTRTDMTSSVAKKYDQLIADGLCVTRRWGEPADVGKIAGALVRGDFPYSTGQVFMVDGGLTIPRL